MVIFLSRHHRWFPTNQQKQKHSLKFGNISSEDIMAPTIISVIIPWACVLVYYSVNAYDCTPAPCDANEKLPCMCTQDHNIDMCMVSPCGDGDVGDGDYTCMCTHDYHPNECVVLRCINSTAYNPYPSYPPAMGYPAYTAYPPASGYPPATGYPPSSGYPPMSAYSPSYECSGYQCSCPYEQPPDCTASSKAPLEGGAPCSCVHGHFLTGCTLKPCGKEEIESGYPYCECVEGQKDTCLSPHCRL